ncbi:MAG: DUF6691 family protein [Cellulophaga sp.]
MKFIKFLLVGIVFGIILVKSEAVSWFRIYEMFKFQSFHMFGIIGSAVGTGVLLVFLLKKMKVKNMEGELITIPNKKKGYKNYLFGGIIFGLGWALIGACPGPLFILLGTGYYSIFVALFSAIFGTFIYGLIKNKLPH